MKKKRPITKCCANSGRKVQTPRLPVRRPTSDEPTIINKTITSAFFAET